MRTFLIRTTWTAPLLLLLLLTNARCAQPARSTADAPAVRYVDPDPATGTSTAAVVKPGPLVLTTNFLPMDAAGRLVGAGDTEAQIAQVLENVRRALATVDADFDDLVKVNVYAADQEAVTQVRAAFAETFTGTAKPAVTYAVGRLRHPEARVAMDVVAVTPRAHEEPGFYRAADVYGPEGQGHAAVMPAGGHVYVSGQVARGDDLIAAMRETFEASLARLSYMGLSTEDITQVKIFLDDIERVDTVEQELARYFRHRPAPPFVSLEWVHEGFDIEIEMLASRSTPSAERPADDNISYTTPPGMREVPVYSRVAEIHGGDVVFISGLYGDPSLSGAEQIEDIFSQMKEILPETGADFDHLAKGTYYVTDWEIVRHLGTVRGQYYDPKRPPTSSLIPIRGVGQPGRALTIDFIGVVPPPPEPME